MKIRKKVLLLISLTLIGLITIVLGTVSTIILNSFRKLEAEETKKNLQRLQGFLDEEIQELNAISKDWGGWDDTYFFVQNQDPQYIENNIYADIFENLKLNLFLLYNKNLDLALNSTYNLGSQQLEQAQPELLLELQQKEHLLRFTDDRGETKGFIILNEHLYFIVLRPILDSASQGPNQGTIVMARIIDANKIKELEHHTKLSINIHHLSELSENLQSIYHDLYQDENEFESLVEIKNQHIISGFILLRDIEYKPIALLEIDSRRDIYKRGNQAVFSWFFH
jgi:adenylate cyclase